MKLEELLVKSLRNLLFIIHIEKGYKNIIFHKENHKEKNFTLQDKD